MTSYYLASTVWLRRATTKIFCALGKLINSAPSPATEFLKFSVVATQIYITQMVQKSLYNRCNKLIQLYWYTVQVFPESLPVLSHKAAGCLM